MAENPRHNGPCQQSVLAVIVLLWSSAMVWMGFEYVPQGELLLQLWPPQQWSREAVGPLRDGPNGRSLGTTFRWETILVSWCGSVLTSRKWYHPMHPPLLHTAVTFLAHPYVATETGTVARDGVMLFGCSRHLNHAQLPSFLYTVPSLGYIVIGPENRLKHHLSVILT